MGKSLAWALRNWTHAGGGRPDRAFPTRAVFVAKGGGVLGAPSTRKSMCDRWEEWLVEGGGTFLYLSSKHNYNFLRTYPQFFIIILALLSYNNYYSVYDKFFGAWLKRK
jgi:hypothetical protein